MANDAAFEIMNMEKMEDPGQTIDIHGDTERILDRHYKIFMEWRKKKAEDHLLTQGMRLLKDVNYYNSCNMNFVSWVMDEPTEERPGNLGLNGSKRRKLKMSEFLDVIRWEIEDRVVDRMSNSNGARHEYWVI